MYKFVDVCVQDQVIVVVVVVAIRIYTDFSSIPLVKGPVFNMCISNCITSVISVPLRTRILLDGGVQVTFETTKSLNAVGITQPKK